MNRDNVFGYPILAPIRAAHGLGNMLFPWARCYLWCKDHGLQTIAPFWTKIRIGPYLRREKDKRNYQRFFDHSGYISGLRRLVLLATLRRVPEDLREQMLNSPDEAKTIVVFTGMKGWFKPMKSRQAEVLAELKRITKPVYLNMDLSGTEFIGIHVRRGDFSIPTSSQALQEGKHNYQMPLEWYISALKLIRAGLGFEAKAFIFSDGSETELQDLLNLRNVSLFRGGSAITDLLALSQACGMIASGSSFSMWASFLGQVPCVWYPGQRRQYVIGSDDEATLEPELEAGAALPDRFLAVIWQRWQYA